MCGFWGSFLSMNTAQSDSDMHVRLSTVAADYHSGSYMHEARDSDSNVYVLCNILKAELVRAT